MDQLDGAVSGLMRSVGSEVVMPRFRNLQAGDVDEKSPGEIVTVADREAEERLTEGLRRLGGGARIVGEEACESDAGLLRDLGKGTVWLVDPVDGTSNFAAGRAPFGMIIALVKSGITVAGWLYDPLTGRMCHARRGEGAFIDGKPVRAGSVRRVRPVAALATQFMMAGQREETHRRGEAAFDLVSIPRCAAEHYPRICLGENDVALFQRTLPWDHAAGVLFLVEAGGRAVRWDGSDYRVDDGKSGLIVAASSALCNRAAAALLPAIVARPRVVAFA